MTGHRKPLDFFWFIPVSGDGPYLGSEKGHRPPDFRYLKEIGQAVDRLGFGGVLIPTGKNCDDPWMIAAALSSHTERLRFLAALRPGNASPTYFARQAAAIDRISDGRFIVNIVTGGNPAELAGDGIFLPHDQRYEHTAEFLTVFNELLAGRKVDFDGKHVKVRGGRRDNLIIAPNLWAGVGLVRGGAGTALVGDPKTVARRLREYQDLGVDTIIGSGYPHLEEAYRVGELLFPELGLGASANVAGRALFAEFGTSGTGVRVSAS